MGPNSALLLLADRVEQLNLKISVLTARLVKMEMKVECDLAMRTMNDPSTLPPAVAREEDPQLNDFMMQAAVSRDGVFDEEVLEQTTLASVSFAKDHETSSSECRTDPAHDSTPRANEQTNGLPMMVRAPVPKQAVRSSHVLRNVPAGSLELEQPAEESDVDSFQGVLDQIVNPAASFESFSSCSLPTPSLGRARSWGVTGGPVVSLDSNARTSHDGGTKYLHAQSIPSESVTSSSVVQMLRHMLTTESFDTRWVKKCSTKPTQRK